MIPYPYLAEYAFRKPYSQIPELSTAFDYGVTLSDLGLSAVAAGQAGYVLVIPPISKKRAGIWVKKPNLHYFEAAERVIQEMVEESERVRDELVHGRLDEALDSIVAEAKRYLDEQYDPSGHIEGMGQVQVRFERLLKDLAALKERLAKHSLFAPVSGINETIESYESSLREAQEPMTKALADELQSLTQAYDHLNRLLQDAVHDPDFRDSFVTWTKEEKVKLTVKNAVAKAGEYLVTILSNQGTLHLEHPLYNRYQAALTKIESSLALDPWLETMERLMLQVGSSFEQAFKMKVHTVKNSQEANILPAAPRIVFELDRSLDLEPLYRHQVAAYDELSKHSDVEVDTHFEVHSRHPWELQVDYRFQFKDLVEGYRCQLKIESFWKETYKGVLSHKRSRQLLLGMEPEVAQDLAKFSLLQGFLNQNKLPNSDGLLKKRDKYLDTCKFFIEQNMEKDGFHTFAERHNSFACGSLKQAKNFKAILEKRFADFSLARLATSHADIFKGHQDRRVRQILFYAGPTNSGKSYMAFEELAKYETGVYLGPLRLLALEGVEELQKRGKKVSLITGEERDIVPGATHISQTIETFDREQQYDCAIIDEIQMISDKGRGGAFMEALLNINADKVVLTGSDNAVEIVQEICSLTGDLFKVKRLERKNPLSWIGRYSLGKGTKDDLKGTAIVAFTKKSIHMIRNRLLNEGYTVSVIYGALSPDVRRSEAERFRSGETDILVATDAIGMGLNLPIKRVLFSQSDKFDGESIRDLEGTEVIQIGGRAGRYGMFQEAGEVGVVPGLTKFQVDESVIRDGFYKKLGKIDRVYVSITYRQLWDSYQTLNHELSSIIQTLAAKNKYTWQKARQAHMVDSERFNKAQILEQAASRVAKELGIDKSGTKALRAMNVPFPMIFRLLNTPFDSDQYEEVLYESFENVLRVVSQEKPRKQWVDIDTAPIKGSVALERAENNVKALTLHYYFASFFESFEESPYELTPDEILLLRKEVGIQISNYLAKNETLDGIAGPRRRPQRSGNRDEGGRSQQGQRPRERSKSGSQGRRPRRRGRG
ncbi:Helicase conserved C-terminal domain-containing protein [Pseudobacteriovorax antillogorgiicola]|uniref:Helicase conserved C-terminal domain-containing protein n=1 Tax=Pseudobacteriovorax antillogorgiicola TaxID=1513793 RepID=A0A1Y6CAL9_9BACT|nr:helicase-like protein [Pseudobacteriovorax antillogorgiicola]SMF53528.1 Helicase conserved C-terminal domain-containing protein [Pseudobacteriovorax antillogorgiicola]